MNVKLLEKPSIFCQSIYPDDVLELTPEISFSNVLTEEPVDNSFENDVIFSDFDHSIDKADKLDLEVSACSGIIAGLIDSFFVGEFSLDKANEWGDKKVNEFVIHIAKSKGCKSNDIYDAIKYLEDKFPVASDNLAEKFGGGRWHHLYDLSHHFSLIGLVFSIITQFTGQAYGVDKDGKFIHFDIERKELIGSNFHEKVACGVINWFFHMASDMAGSSNTPGKGTGVPGPIVSLIKLCSGLPIFQNKGEDSFKLYEWVNHLFFGTVFGDRDSDGKIINARKFDLRTEIGILGELGKQAIPVVINECVVSAFYTIRRLIIEIQDCDVKTIKDLTKIEPADVLPINNPAIIRMRTVSSGVFVAFDATDAAIRAGIKCGGNGSKFAVDFILHINIVGLGRFCFAAGNDISTVRKQAKENENKYAQELAKFEQAISGFECITLTKEQKNILYSIEKQIILFDINKDNKFKSKEYKKLWLSDWEKQILELDSDAHFNEIDSIYDICNDSEDQKQIDLVLLNTISFKPYYPLGIENDTKYKKIKYSSDYLLDSFAENQTYYDKEKLKNLRKEYSKTYKYVSGKTHTRNIGAIATVATAAAVGTASFFFAPVIAPVAAAAIFSESVAGLSGCALTSASLAAFGGGSLAVGGLGMAGGTAVIAGSGAVIGAAGSAGANTLFTAFSDSSTTLLIDKTVRTIVFSKNILRNELKDLSTIDNIIESFKNQSRQLNSLLDSKKIDLKSCKDKKMLKKQIKILKKNIGIVDNGLKLLGGLIKD